MRVMVTSVFGAILIIGFPTLAAKMQWFDAAEPASVPVANFAADHQHATADVLLAQSDQMPSRGMTMKQVESQYGQPVNRRAPVGDPPITRWEFQSFIVYFEYRHVIHAVEKNIR